MYLGELGGMSLEVTPKKVVLNVNTVDYTCMHCRLKWLSCLALSFFLSLLVWIMVITICYFFVRPSSP